MDVEFRQERRHILSISVMKVHPLLTKSWLRTEQFIEIKALKGQ